MHAALCRLGLDVISGLGGNGQHTLGAVAAAVGETLPVQTPRDETLCTETLTHKLSSECEVMTSWNEAPAACGWRRLAGDAEVVLIPSPAPAEPVRSERLYFWWC